MMNHDRISRILILLLMIIYRGSFIIAHVKHDSEKALFNKTNESIVVSIVACGNPQSKYISMLKRLLLSIAHNKEKHDHYKVYILYDPNDIPYNYSPFWLLCPYNITQVFLLMNKLKFRHKVNVKFRAISSEISNNISAYRNGKKINALTLFKKCATVKLWLPELLLSERAVINLDTDMLVLESLDELWRELSDFPPSSFLGFVEEQYYGAGWYDHYRRLKAGRHGINSGTLLFDLGKARKINSSKIFADILMENPSPSDFSLGDQDVFNVLLSRYPDMYKPLPCRWNRRLEGCLVVEDLALLPGILHGNRDVLYAKEDYTDDISIMHRAAYTMYSQLLFQDALWCVPLSDATPGAKCADLVPPKANVSFYRDGDLFQGTSGKEVYYIFAGLRHLFKNVDAFNRMNLEFSAVKVIPDYILHSIPLGEDIEKFKLSYIIDLNNTLPPT